MQRKPDLPKAGSWEEKISRTRTHQLIYSVRARQIQTFLREMFDFEPLSK